MSALNSNPFSMEGVVVMGSPNELSDWRKDSPSSEVMIWIYAEWCGHCRNFLPTWNSLVNGTDNGNMIFVMMNGDDFVSEQNYPEGYPEIRGYPTIWTMRSGETMPLVYEGSRDPESMQMLLNEMSM